MEECRNKLVSALNNHKTGNILEADRLYKEALALNPNDPMALQYYGLLCAQLDRVDEAISMLKKSLALEPRAEVYCDLADLYENMERKDLTMEVYGKAFSLFPENPALLYKIGLFMYREDKPKEALESLSMAFRYDSENPDINYMLGLILHNMDELENAKFHYNKALEYEKDNAMLYYNLGLISFKFNQFEESINFINQAISLDPENWNFYHSLAYCYLSSKEEDKAIKCFEKALFLSLPENHRLEHGYGNALLSLGNFEKGWKLWDDSRIKMMKHHNLKLPVSRAPKWNGEPLEGKTIYVYTAAGIGDDIFFARYLPELVKQGANVIYKTRGEILSFFREALPEINVIDASTPDNIIHCDFQSPIMSLGRAFNTNKNNIPNANGFLRANPEKVQYYKENFFDNNKFKIGIFWFSGLHGDPKRNAPLKYFMDLSKMDAIQLYSLRKKDRWAEVDTIPEDINIIDLGKTFNDFTDTAATFENLDLIISIDTSLLHLAGIMGKKAFGLVPFNPHWYWTLLDKDSNSVWYKNTQVFRQKNPDDWEEVFSRVYSKINELCQTPII